MLALSQIRLVEMESPYETWCDPAVGARVQQLFCGMVRLKRLGYQTEYPKGILVNDAGDFFGTHLLACRTGTDGTLEPIMGYKLVPARKSQEYRAKFPAIACLEASKANEYVSSVSELVRSCLAEGGDISYDSSWTMLPEYRKDREAAKTLRDILTLLSTMYHEESPIRQWMTCGVTRFKTDQHFEWMGASAVTGEFPLFSSFGEKVKLMHFRSHSAEALAVCEKYMDLWQNRLVLAPAAEVEMPLKKAA